MKNFDHIYVPDFFTTSATDAVKFFGLPIISPNGKGEAIISIFKGEWTVYVDGKDFPVNKELVQRYIRHLFKVARRHWTKRGCPHTATELRGWLRSCHDAGCDLHNGEHYNCGSQRTTYCVVCGEVIED